MGAEILLESGQSIRATAAGLGVAESTLRYRLRRRSQEAVDGRGRQPESCAPYEGVIQSWITQQQQDPGRRESIQSLYALLLLGYGFTGSYKSLWRYVRKRQPPPPLRPHRRVETRPGGQAQLDWGLLRVYVAELGGWGPVSAFHMSLSHSRMWSVQWSRDQGLLSWIGCHNRGFQFLGGIPWSVRIDNLKTAVVKGSSSWGLLHPAYRSYAGQLGFVVDPCRVRQASDKGKVERRIQDVRGHLIGPEERFDTLSSLQQESDRRIRERAERLRCPVTGLSVAQSWVAEQGFLYPLPQTLPTPFDVQVCRTVGRDCLIHFENRQYAVPFAFVGRVVEVRGCAQTVEIYSDHQHLISYPRHTQSRLLIDQACYEGVATPTVTPPTPLGRLGQQLVLPHSWQAPRRSLDAYATLVGQLGRAGGP
jgi:transposase